METNFEPTLVLVSVGRSQVLGSCDPDEQGSCAPDFYCTPDGSTQGCSPDGECGPDDIEGDPPDSPIDCSPDVP
jgi:hypothetical protein